MFSKINIHVWFAFRNELEIHYSERDDDFTNWQIYASNGEAVKYLDAGWICMGETSSWLQL